ncbi:unnamed protein product [Bodo saltans]|uniref:Uncharacterized protein n=1 Tax=Bodo saltans TaxID=75058 RepID=A0A0S4IYU6_BODSA|nr:unnamed protein product [Bodo saltans]|eukprot:CUG59527.1 unnamed protein product [Bodo saltans]
MYQCAARTRRILFPQYRHMHNRLISEVVSQRGCHAFTALSAAEKRDIASITVAEAAHIVRRDMDVSAIFKKLGYMSPSTESVCLRNLPSFVFRPPLKADFDAYLAYLNGTVLQKVDEDYASAVANISSVAISPKIGPRKRGRPRKEDALATAVARSRKSSGPLDKFLQPRESLASRPQTQSCEEKQSQPYEILSGKSALMSCARDFAGCDSQQSASVSQARNRRHLQKTLSFVPFTIYEILSGKSALMSCARDFAGCDSQQSASVSQARNRTHLQKTLSFVPFTILEF